MGRSIMTGALMISIALIVGVACSSSKDSDPTPVKQFKITPASGVPTAAVTTPASQSPAAASPASGTPQGTATSGGGGGSTITIAASNILFDKTKLTASAGTVKIQFDNKDGGVPHDINVFDGKDATGKSLGATAIEAGPTKQELAIDLKAGTYYFQCDVHPTTMSGTLTVT
jgi:plastocyanin